LETCADFDDELFRAFVEGRRVPPRALQAVLRRATLAGELVPVLAGSALLNRGVDLLLDAVCDYLPAPEDRAGSGAGARPLAALVFKVHVDSAGFLCFVRVFDGELRTGDEVEAASDGRRFRIEQLLRMHAMDREPVERVAAGDLAALLLPAPLATGETLRAPGTPIQLEPVRFSEPVITVALEPLTSAGGAELERAARLLATEDPTLRVHRDSEQSPLLVSGMGELHLDVFGARLTAMLVEPVRVGRPSVARFEGVRGRAQESAVLSRKVGGEECSAQVAVEVAPTGGDAPASVVAVPELGAPPEVVDAVVAALRALLAGGVVEPYPARGLTVAVRAVAAVGQGEILADLAASAGVAACRRAFVSAGRQLLEPAARLRVSCPTEALRSVLADLQSRGVEITDVVPAGATSAVEGRALLSALLGYANPLRSMTQGKGSVEVELEGLTPVAGARKRRGQS
jgi:elongation factor G